MGALGKMLGICGCEYISGTDPVLAAENKQWFMFKTNEATEITEFEEIPVSIINNNWQPGLAADAETIDGRSYCGVSLIAGMEIFFDGPVISITLASGSGVAYYIKGDNPGV